MVKISILAELDRIGWEFQSVGSNEVKCRCPAHADETPSCGLNVDSGLWECHACHAKGDFVSFLAHAFKQPRAVIWEDLSRRYKLDNIIPIEYATIERYHQQIWQEDTLRSQLYKRGLTDDTIRQYRLGVTRNRITIPIFGQSGACLNVRHYLPGAPSNEKMKNTRGHGKLRLYPIDQLKYNRIVLCGGEVKALAVAQHLNQHDIGAITVTSGEGNWDPEFSALFKNKVVWIMFDIDEAGRTASQRVASILNTFTEWQGVVNLPLDPEKYPTGDINDFLGPEQKTTEDLLKLLEETLEWSAPKRNELEQAPEPDTAISLVESIHASNTGKRTKVRAVISAVDNTPYVVPKTVSCICDRSSEYCFACPVFATTKESDKFPQLVVPDESPAILDMIAVHRNSLEDAVRIGLGIPPCDKIEFKYVDYYAVEDVRLAPRLEISDRTANDLLQPAYCIGNSIESNEPYELTGRMYPHPKTQQLVFLASKYQATQDALSNYSPTNLEHLRVFNPNEWSVAGIEERLKSIYEDLSANVTHIFQRQDLHLVIDLAYHSCLHFKFDNRSVKGWSEVLIVGDSSQGKSESVIHLMRHYGLGEKVDCKNASVAGLLGGLQKSGNRFFVTWGVIPTHDKRLVVLEELKGTPVSVFSHLTDMRSSGIAEIPKIEKRRAHARTRLIAISNPRSDRPMSSYNFGVEAIRELVGSPEDIRRFDLSLVVSSTQIPADVLNKLQKSRPSIEHRFTSELCRELVLFAWTRTAEQIFFDTEAIEEILDSSSHLCSLFSELIPMVDRGSMRFKIARLAIALAVRTFSTGEDFHTIRVQKCHIEFIRGFIERIYSDPICGYRDFSFAVSVSEKLLTPDEIRKRILQTPFPKDFIDSMLQSNSMELRDLQDWCGYDRTEALTLLSFFVRHHALIRDGGGYRKNPLFIELLKELRDSSEAAIATRPEFIPEF